MYFFSLIEYLLFIFSGEPIFEPLPGPSSLANGSLSFTGNSSSDSFLDALMDIVDDVCICPHTHWMLFK